MKRNDVDSWCKIPVKTLDVEGVKVTINGLTTEKLDVLTTGKKSNIDQSVALIAACCEIDGKPVDAEKIKKSRASVFNVLSRAVADVNGLLPGNLSATADDDSSSV